MFEVVEEKPTQYELRGCRSPNSDTVYALVAEDAAVKALGKSFFNASRFAFTSIRNLASRAPLRDLEILRAVLTDWLDAVEPQFAAIEGKLGYNVPRLGVHRLIKTPDGRQHASREEAATHLLLTTLKGLRGTLTNATWRALCNANQYGRHDGDESDLQLEFRARDLFATEQEKYRWTRARVEKVRNAIAAMAEVRALPLKVVRP